MTSQTDNSVLIEEGANYATAVVNDKSKAFILATLVALNLLATIWMLSQWKIAERETRLLEYYLLELDAKVIASGIKKPEDAIAKHLRDGK